MEHNHSTHRATSTIIVPAQYNHNTSSVQSQYYTTTKQWLEFSFILVFHTSRNLNQISLWLLDFDKISTLFLMEAMVWVSDPLFLTTQLIQLKHTQFYIHMTIQWQRVQLSSQLYQSQPTTNNSLILAGGWVFKGFLAHDVISTFCLGGYPSVSSLEVYSGSSIIGCLADLDIYLGFTPL